MVDNVTSNSGAGVGAVSATDDIGGVHYPITKITIGALDASTLLTGGSGTVDAGCPRVTLATNDAAVTALQLIDTAVSGAGFNITQFAGVSVPIGAGLEATAVRVTLPTDGTGLVSAAQSGTWNVGTVTTVATCATVTNLSQLGGQAIAMGTGTYIVCRSAASSKAD